MTFALKETGGCVECETFERHGDLVVVLRFLTETITDEDEAKIIDALRRFVSFQKKTPQRYHVVVDTHTVLVFPLDRIINVYNYIARKEQYLREHAISTSYLIQGKVAEMALGTLNTMFETWTHVRTFQCVPSTGAHEYGIPVDTYAKVLAFIDSEVPPTAR